MTGALVTDAGHGYARLSTGVTIKTHTIVWSAGVRPNPPAACPAPSERIEPDQRRRAPARIADGVFAIGDLASVDVGGVELPMLSPPAMQEGRYVARAIRARRSPGTRGRSSPSATGTRRAMATVGRNAAVAELERYGSQDPGVGLLAVRPPVLPDRLSQPRGLPVLGLELRAGGPAD